MPGGISDGDSFNSPDISSVIQELVDSFNYSAGGDMLIYTFSSGSVNQRFRWKAEELIGFDAPLLHIEYVTGGPAGVQAATARLLLE